ncbi:MAG: MerR family transcriptional regulator, partial [Gammaproteobacteria bacterium]|nr:MerR family transcriptional regulator [Gammaproteobacteria bacterium]
DLCTLSDTPRRTIRYYVQEGLVDRPEGIKRGAYYTQRHLEQLMAIRTWRRAGISLERIRELAAGTNESTPQPPPPAAKAGDIALHTHVTLAPGVELVIDPCESGLNAEAVRALVRRATSIVNEPRKNT